MISHMKISCSTTDMIFFSFKPVSCWKKFSWSFKSCSHFDPWEKLKQMLFALYTSKRPNQPAQRLPCQCCCGSNFWWRRLWAEEPLVCTTKEHLGEMQQHFRKRWWMAPWDGENIVGVQETDGLRPNAAWVILPLGGALRLERPCNVNRFLASAVRSRLRLLEASTRREREREEK